MTRPTPLATLFAIGAPSKSTGRTKGRGGTMQRRNSNRFAPTLPILACFLALSPGVASAALSISIGPDVTYFPPSHEGYFDLVFHETGTPTDEGLFAYDLYIRRDNPGLRLLRADKPDNWVFT